MPLAAVKTSQEDPPYPADTQANGWHPELHIDRILTSDTWILAAEDERPWLLRIWFECWRSCPAGTMPADRLLFARRIGCTQQFLAAHAEILLRGWTLHSDGRLYHGYIASQVITMLDRRRSAAKKVRDWREKKKAGDQAECNQLRIGNLPVSYRQEQEQEQEQDLREEAIASCPTFVPKAEPGARNGVPYAAIRDLWCSTLPMLRKPIAVEHWTSARKAQIRARWADQLPDLDAWKQAFGLVAKSQFLTGQASTQPGRKPFEADLFWITKPENLLKLYEGKYDNA